ncbi:MAG: hypothetical protein HKN26_14180 [Acidimicrobiales bacterium]|nr:hypothetical protein [Acidimicrobiales bacterium]
MGRRSAQLLVVALIASALTTSLPALGGPAHGGLVDEQPQVDTLSFDDGAVQATAQIGNRIFVGGTFTTVTTNEDVQIHQAYLASYNAITGNLDTSFLPELDGEVESLAIAADGQSIYVGGTFNHVNGTLHNRLARIDFTGQLIGAFNPNPSASVRAIEVGNDKVYFGGQFQFVGGVARSRLAAVDETTGALDLDFDIPLTGPIGRAGSGSVRWLQLTNDNSRLVIQAASSHFDGQERWGVGMVDVSGPVATLHPWRTRLVQDNLHRCAGNDYQASDGDISPDGTYFVIVQAGHDGPPVCDTAIRFPIDVPVGEEGDVQPDWVSRHFDSVYSVAVTDTAVYTGGHFRAVPSATAPDPWPGDADTRYNIDNAADAAELGDDIVLRDQIAAINPLDGKALDWESKTNGFQGTLDLTVTDSGLLVGHDGWTIGNFSIGRHGLLALPPAPDAVDPTTTITSPTHLESADIPFTVTGTASDDTAIHEVRWTLFSYGTGQWLRRDGTYGAWQYHQADLADPGATTTVWTIDLDVVPGEYKVYAFAVDAAGNITDPRPNQRFFLTSTDAAAPSAVVTTPATDNLTVTSPFTISGTATDDSNVRQVRYQLFSVNEGQWLHPDGSWGNFTHRQATLSAPDATSTTWHADLYLEPGSYRLFANARDGVHNLSPTELRRFTVVPTDAGPPAITIDSPTFNQIVSSPLVVTGTATDDVGVTEVKWNLYSFTEQGWLKPNGNWGLWTSHDANVTSPGATTTAWDVPLTLPPGRYRLYAFGIDGEGHLTAPKPSVRFTVE